MFLLNNSVNANALEQKRIQEAKRAEELRRTKEREDAIKREKANKERLESNKKSMQNIRVGDSARAKADRILNEPGYASRLAFASSRTSEFGDPNISSWARDRMRLGEMDRQKTGRSGNGFAGGDIDLKNAKGSISHIGGVMLYSPDKSNSDEVYKVQFPKDATLKERHELIKSMHEGSLDESAMRDSGLKFEKTSYNRELAGHQERKKLGILTTGQVDRKNKSITSMTKRKEALRGKLDTATPQQSEKINRTIGKLDSLIGKQQTALDKSEKAVEDFARELVGNGLADPNKADENENAKKQIKDKETYNALKTELVNSKDPQKLRDLIVKIIDADIQENQKIALKNTAEVKVNEVVAVDRTQNGATTELFTKSKRLQPVVPK